MAELVYWCGVMKSGKSDRLIKHAYSYDAEHLPIVTIKPDTDTKNGKMITSRAGFSREADVYAKPEQNLAWEVRQRALGAGAIYRVFVDEAQFLTPEQVGQLYELTRADNIPVDAYGLRSDFQTHLFPGSLRLFEIADRIEKLNSGGVCRCGNVPEFNTRRIGDRYVFEGEQVAIDGVEATYDSLCGQCYVKEGGTI